MYINYIYLYIVKYIYNNNNTLILYKQYSYIAIEESSVLHRIPYEINEKVQFLINQNGIQSDIQTLKTIEAYGTISSTYHPNRIIIDSYHEHIIDNHVHQGLEWDWHPLEDIYKTKVCIFEIDIFYIAFTL